MDTLPLKPDWDRIKKYGKRTLKRHTKKLVLSMGDTNPFAWWQLPNYSKN